MLPLNECFCFCCAVPYGQGKNNDKSLLPLEGKGYTKGILRTTRAEGLPLED
jgi:hypothetical protein